MAEKASYLVTKDGACGILVPADVEGKLQIKALVAFPQKQGNGRLLVETFAASQQKNTAIYVQADNTAVRFYEKCGFKTTFDLTAKEYCTPMMMVTTGAEPPELPDGHWIVDHCFPKSTLRKAGWSQGPRAPNAKGAHTARLPQLCTSCTAAAAVRIVHS